MAAVECARYTRDSGNTGSVTLNYTAPVAAGQRIILAVNGAALNAATGFTVTDSKGNTFTQRAFAICSVAPVDGQLALLDAPAAAAVGTSDTYTVTCTGRTPDKWCVLGLAVDDISGGFDAAATNTGGTGAALDTGTTAAAAQNAELEVAAFAFTDTGGATGLTLPAGWTQLAKAVASPSSAPKSLVLGYRYVDVAGTRNATGTLDSAQAWVAAIAAYKQDAAAARSFCWLRGAAADLPMAVTVA